MAETEDEGTGWTKPVSKTIGALSGTPMLLVLAILNAGMFAMLAWLITKSAEYRFQERTEIIQLLTACIEEGQKPGQMKMEIN